MKLYKISLSFSVHNNTYYVAAESFDLAAEMVAAIEPPEASIKAIEPVADFGPGEYESLLVSDKALAVLTGEGA